MEFFNKVLERDLKEISLDCLIGVGSIGGASIEVDNTSYIYNGPNQMKNRDEDFENLLIYLGL